MDTIRITIPHLRYFRKFAKTPRNILWKDRLHIIKILSDLDKEFIENYNPNAANNPTPQEIFLDGKIWSVLQLLWNSKTKKFYDDVGVEAREHPPESENIPIELNPFTPIPPGSFLILTPDSGC